MGNQQLFAKIGVFILLGVNVAAYYFFWPSPNGNAVSETKGSRETKGEAQLLPTPGVKPTEVAKPKDLTPAAFKDAPPLHVPVSNEKEPHPDELVRRLLDHMDKEAKSGKPPASPFDVGNGGVPETKATPEAPMFPPDQKPRPLPPLQAEPIDPSKVGVTSPLTPRRPTSPWTFYKEPAGAQTLLVAKLQEGSRLVAEFRILCDRLETPSSGTEVLAVGNVAFNGAGGRGECRRLTIPLYDMKLLFEDQVVASHPNMVGVVRAERLLWEMPAVLPATHVNPNPAVLGPPK